MTQTTIAPAPPGAPAAEALLQIDDLAVSFDVGTDEPIQAVDGLTLTIHPRQTLALVGESGCGKSVTALSIMRLLPAPPARFDRGRILFEGADLLSLSESKMLSVRGGQVAMIFQEPTGSLNPVYTIGDQIVEAVRRHQRLPRRQAHEAAVEAMEAVGITDARRRMTAFPHEFSGGMCQRVMTAMALACRPKLLLADEPTTALDVTIQAQILELLLELQRSTGMSMMFITHDLCVVAENADVVCVMYAGRVVEYARVFDLFDRPFHPYTRGLLQSLPKLRERRSRLVTVGELVSDPREFERLPGYKYGVVPWWPSAPPPKDFVRGEGAGVTDYILHEVEPGHWVGCWRTSYLQEHPEPRPNLSFRRGENKPA